jgi:hypothetical protein
MEYLLIDSILHLMLHQACWCTEHDNFTKLQHGKTTTCLTFTALSVLLWLPFLTVPCGWLSLKNTQIKFKMFMT